MPTRAKLPKVRKTEIAVLKELLRFHIEESKDCGEIANSVSGDRGWWRARQGKHARFAAVIEIVLHNFGEPGSAS